MKGSYMDSIYERFNQSFNSRTKRNNTQQKSHAAHNLLCPIVIIRLPISSIFVIGCVIVTSLAYCNNMKLFKPNVNIEMTYRVLMCLGIPDMFVNVRLNESTAYTHATNGTCHLAANVGFSILLPWQVGIFMY